MNEQVSVELKPCPFCGGMAFMDDNPEIKVNWIECKVCGASPHVFSNTVELAIEVWNKRWIDKEDVKLRQQLIHEICSAVQDNEELIAENERLKRLDENVKKQINSLKLKLEALNYHPHYFEYGLNISIEIRKLESLYK